MGKNSYIQFPSLYLKIPTKKCVTIIHKTAECPNCNKEFCKVFWLNLKMNELKTIFSISRHSQGKSLIQVIFNIYMRYFSKGILTNWGNKVRFVQVSPRLHISEMIFICWHLNVLHTSSLYNILSHLLLQTSHLTRHRARIVEIETKPFIEDYRIGMVGGPIQTLIWEEHCSLFNCLQFI